MNILLHAPQIILQISIAFLCIFVKRFSLIFRYPNLYPYWTHLYFAKLKFDVDPSVRAIQCMLSPNQTELLVLFKRAKPAYKPNNDVFIINKLNNVFFVSYSFKDLDDLYNKDPLVSKRRTDSIYGWSARDMESTYIYQVIVILTRSRYYKFSYCAS